MPKQSTRSVVIAPRDMALVERFIEALRGADAPMLKEVSARLGALEASVGMQGRCAATKKQPSRVSR